MLVSHKIALDPNNAQATYFARACGVARFAYNWALAEWIRQYKAGEKPSQLALRRQLNAIKHEQFPWMLEVSKNAPQMAIINLGRAFENFFKGNAEYPTFKKKGIHDSFQLTNDQFHTDEYSLHVPKLGAVRMREMLRFSGKILGATISRTAGRWFVSIAVDVPTSTATTSENQAVVGVDVGLNAFATLSTGEKILGPKPHRTLDKRLRLLSRSLSRKKKGSANRYKARHKLARLHTRIANIRQDAIHKLTTKLVEDYKTIAIEDLNVAGMLRNRHLARSLADAGLAEFGRQLKYKSKWLGRRLIVADRYFPSSKLCSVCGYKHDQMQLSDRSWWCPTCNTMHDRDINAAKNLKNLAASSAVTACGEESSGRARKRSTKLASVKQEPNGMSIHV